MSDVYISEECIMCPNCFHVYDNPLILNCGNNCVICEKCVEKMANSKNQLIDESGVIKLEVEEQFLQCICGSYFEKTKSRTDVGLESVIRDFKCEG